VNDAHAVNANDDATPHWMRKGQLRCFDYKSTIGRTHRLYFLLAGSLPYPQCPYQDSSLNDRTLMCQRCKE
jgi:hypothetical protein